MVLLSEELPEIDRIDESVGQIISVNFKAS